MKKKSNTELVFLCLFTGMLLGIIGISIIDLFKDSPDCICNPPDCIYEVTQKESPVEITFEYNRKEMIVFDIEGYVLDAYNNYSIFMINGDIQTLLVKLNKNVTNYKSLICVEHKLDDVIISELYQVRVPDELYLIGKDYRVDCFNLDIEGDTLFLTLDQKDYDVEDSIIKIHLL